MNHTSVRPHVPLQVLRVPGNKFAALNQARVDLLCLLKMKQHQYKARESLPNGAIILIRLLFDKLPYFWV